MGGLPDGVVVAEVLAEGVEVGEGAAATPASNAVVKVIGPVIVLKLQTGTSASV